MDIHIHPAPEAYPIDVTRIEVITVRCPVRGHGLVIRELTAAGDPELFAFFLDLVAQGGELQLDSDAPLVGELARIGFLVVDDEIVDWPRFEIPLEDTSPEALHETSPEALHETSPEALQRASTDAPVPDACWVVAPTLRFQSAFALHPGVRWPPDYDEQDGRLRCFADGPACWVGEPTEIVTPFWLSADAAAVVADLVPGAVPPPLPPPLARALAQVGALVPPDAARPSPLAPFARHRTAFEADGYVIARRILAGAELAALRRYYAALLAAGLVPFGDRQSPARFSLYNDPIGRFVHARLAGAMSAVVGQPVEPSFSYFFSYVEGAVLEPHKDRAQAEFSISLQLDHRPEPAAETGWPLRFSFDDGRAVAADLAIGDAVLYHGRALTHHRTRLPAGQRSSVLVLEYVPSDFSGLRI